MDYYQRHAGKLERPAAPSEIDRPPRLVSTAVGRSFE